MPYNPLTVVGWWLAGMLSLAASGAGAWLLYLGLSGRAPMATAAGGAALLLLALLGRYPVLALFARADAEPPRRGRVRPSLRVRRADGLDLEVEADGPPGAPPMVLVHDWGFHSGEWRGVRERLGRRFRLLMPDLPGHGHSPPRADDGWHVEALARDLRRVIECAGPGPVLLLGHGAGGLIVLAYCRLFPRDLHERIAGLVLASTPPASPLALAHISGLRRALVSPLLRLTAALPPLARLVHRAAFLSGAAHLFARRAGFASVPGRRSLDLAAHFVPQGAPRAFARGALAMLRHDERATLRTVAIPSLVISGARDPASGREVASRMRRDLDGEAMVLDDAGTLMTIEHPERLASAVEQFAGECLALYA